MANDPDQKLLVLSVDPHRTQDLTPVLQRYDWWGDGWRIQQVSLAPYGDKNTQVFVAVVLNKERTGDRHTPPPS